MKRWIALWGGVMMVLLGTAHASQKPLKQPRLLQSDKPASISASLVEEVYTRGMVLHASGKTQLWFDDRVTRQKHWGTMWIWPLEPGQKLCVRALEGRAEVGMELHPFLKHAALEWPSISSKDAPVCFEYPKADVVKPPAKRQTKKQTKKQPKAPELAEPPLIQKAIEAHWAVEDLTSIKARQTAIFDKIPTAGPAWFRKKHQVVRDATSPSNPSRRWVVLRYPSD